MEKKGSRSVQPLSKGLGTETKKSQDVSTKLLPRGGRRREPTGGSFSAKNETNRKLPTQRNKVFDKRPRPRGSYYSGAVGGKEESGVEPQDAELGSVFVQGSKKQSLNHLLNFHFEPRENQCHLGGINRPKQGHRWSAFHKHKYNKEQFLQANCQFIVKASGDYKPYINNPDALVNWDLIEQVNIHVMEFPSCPICLYPPVAAKMTRCGHIYCWSCVLHYLALSDQTFRKCPICYEAVHKKDLKSVVAIPHPSLNTSENITFKLMKRLRGSLTAYPVDQPMRDDGVLFNISDKDSNTIYSKLLLANKSEVMSIIERERNELQVQILEDEHSPERCFIEQALSQLGDRENIMSMVEDLSEELQSKLEINSLDTDVTDDRLSSSTAQLNENRPRFESVSSDNLGSDDFDSNLEGGVSVEDLEISSTGRVQQPTKYFYFYQATDGQHIYLHALNIRMLEHTYGCLEFCPKTITGRIVEKESGSMTEELRKRLRYLQHLPVTCQFEVAEIMLKPPIVGKETVNFYQEQIENRRKTRQRRSRDEKRREKRITEEENRKMGKYPAANIHIESHYQFPEVGIETTTLEQDVIPHTPQSERSLSPGLYSQAGSSSAVGSLTADNEYSGPSFAKMLSSNKSRTPTWPAVQSKPATVSNPRYINITGAQSKFIPIRTRTQSDSEPEPDGYVPAPSFNQSFGDAIAIALEKAALGNGGDDNSQSKQGGKRKKKNKQKVLFATSIAFSGN